MNWFPTRNHWQWLTDIAVHVSGAYNYWLLSLYRNSFPMGLISMNINFHSGIHKQLHREPCIACVGYLINKIAPNHHGRNNVWAWCPDAVQFNYGHFKSFLLMKSDKDGFTMSQLAVNNRPGSIRLAQAKLDAWFEKNCWRRKVWLIGYLELAGSGLLKLDEFHLAKLVNETASRILHVLNKILYTYMYFTTFIGSWLFAKAANIVSVDCNVEC